MIRLIRRLLLPVALLVHPVHAQNADHATDQGSDAVIPYAMTISGGISLGNYEAGMNWVIVETFRRAQQGKINAIEGELTSITGASAGSINALISALRYCQSVEETGSGVVNNLLYRTWIDVGFDGLLPGGDEGYDVDLPLSGSKLRDGVLSRKPFKKVIRDLKKYVTKHRYRKGCRIRIGMSLTRERATRTQIANIDVLTQRFFVPLELVINPDGQVEFSNYRSLHPGSAGYGNIVFLPEKQGIVSIDDVIVTALASSAFPIAFGRVALDVCERHGQYESDACPEGFYRTRAVYVDGGVFDNIPLGSARMLAEDIRTATGELKVHDYEYPFSYIYMSPANKRFVDTRLGLEHGFEEGMSPGHRAGSAVSSGGADKEQGEELEYGIMDQMGFLGDTINIGMGSELYSTLRSYDWNNVDRGDGDIRERYKSPSKRDHPRRLLLTSRGSPLTADYLSHFGAFAARMFREYDYYVGVYDGIYNAAGAICNDREADDLFRCRTETMAELYTALKLDDCPRAAYMYRLLYNRELCACNSQEPLCCEPVADKDDPFYILHATMRSSLSLDFDDFLHSLYAHKHVFDDASLNAMMLREDMWYIDYARKITTRMRDLEIDSDKASGQARLISLSNYVVNSIDLTDEDFVWALSSVPDSEGNWLLHAVPHEIGFDISQSGMVGVYHWKFDPWWQGFYPEIEIGYHAVSDVTEKKNFAHLGASFRRRVSRFWVIPSSSIGFGYGAYRQANGLHLVDVPSDNRATVSLGLFADKFRITYGQRLDGTEFERNQSRMVMFSITDVKGLFYWLFGAAN